MGAKVADWSLPKIFQHATRKLISNSSCIGKTSKTADWTNLPLELFRHVATKQIGISVYILFNNVSQRKMNETVDRTWSHLSDLLQHVTKKLNGASYILFGNVSQRTTSKAVDWTNLPPELLQLIAGKLTHISDYIGFRSVCISWRSAACPTDLHPQLPWLLLPHRRKDRCTLTFFNPFKCRVYNFSFPENNVQKWIFGSCHGWLVMVDQDSQQPVVSLLNPIIRSQMFLPPLPQKPYNISKSLLCFNPSTISQQPLQQLMVVIWSDEKLFIFRHGDENWGEIQAPCHTLEGSIVYFEKSVHVVDGHGRLAIIDHVSLTLQPLTEELDELSVSDPDYKLRQFAHLVEATGSLFLIAWKPKSSIHVFKLSKGALKWVRIKNGIEGITVLTSFMQSISVPKQDFFDDGSGNQIYLCGNELFHEVAIWDRAAASVRSTIMEMPDCCKDAFTLWVVPSLY